MFSKNDIKIIKSVQAREQKIEREEAWNLLKDAKEIIVGRGKHTVVFHPDIDSKEEILQACLSKSGNLRAPSLRVGKRHLIGFNQDMYDRFFAD